MVADWLTVALLAILVVFEVRENFQREIQRIVWRVKHRKK